MDQADAIRKVRKARALAQSEQGPAREVALRRISQLMAEHHLRIEDVETEQETCARLLSSHEGALELQAGALGRVIVIPPSRERLATAMREGSRRRIRRMEPMLELALEHVLYPSAGQLEQLGDEEKERILVLYLDAIGYQRAHQNVL